MWTRRGSKKKPHHKNLNLVFNTGKKLCLEFIPKPQFECSKIRNKDVSFGMKCSRHQHRRRRREKNGDNTRKPASFIKSGAKWQYEKWYISFPSKLIRSRSRHDKKLQFRNGCSAHTHTHTARNIYLDWYLKQHYLFLSCDFIGWLWQNDLENCATVFQTAYKRERERGRWKMSKRWTSRRSISLRTTFNVLELPIASYSC